MQKYERINWREVYLNIDMRHISSNAGIQEDLFRGLSFGSIRVNYYDSKERRIIELLFVQSMIFKF